MQLTLMSPTNSQIIEINWLEVQTDKGNFVIQPGHMPMIVLLTPNQELTMELLDGSVTLMSITGGILEITRTAVTLLITQ